jgi:hypothetical protein
LARGSTHQLSPLLADALGNAVSPTQSFTFASSNPGLVTVSPTGFCTAAPVDLSVLQQGGSVEIEISYPWADGVSGAKIHASVEITITVPPGVTGPWGMPKIYPPNYVPPPYGS